MTTPNATLGARFLNGSIGLTTLNKIGHGKSRTRKMKHSLIDDRHNNLMANNVFM
jgi:hypothetical protein